MAAASPLHVLSMHAPDAEARARATRISKKLFPGSTQQLASLAVPGGALAALMVVTVRLGVLAADVAHPGPSFADFRPTCALLESDAAETDDTRGIIATA